MIFEMFALLLCPMSLSYFILCCSPQCPVSSMVCWFSSAQSICIIKTLRPVFYLSLSETLRTLWATFQSYLTKNILKLFIFRLLQFLGPDQKTFTCFLLSKDQESSLNLASDGSSSSLLRDRTWKCWIQIFQLKFKWGGGSTKGMWIIWKHPAVRARWNMIFQVGSKKGNYFVKYKKIKEKKENSLFNLKTKTMDILRKREK